MLVYLLLGNGVVTVLLDNEIGGDPTGEEPVQEVMNPVFFLFPLNFFTFLFFAVNKIFLSPEFSSIFYKIIMQDIEYKKVIAHIV